VRRRNQQAEAADSLAQIMTRAGLRTTRLPKDGSWSDETIREELEMGTIPY
jgi:hypothetical protein